MRPPEFKLARTAAEGRWACDIFPLEDPGDPRYEPLEKLLGLYRGGSNLLLKDLDPAARRTDRLHMVVAGPRGSGKSTLVLQSFAQCREMGIYPVHVDVLTALDPANIAWSDLLLTLVSGVDAALERDGVEIDTGTVEEVRRWFVERLLSEEHVKELNLEVKAGAEGGSAIPFVGKLFAKVTAAFKGGSKYREEIRTRIDRSPNELIDKVNDYLTAARAALSKKKEESLEILFFFDNLEKVTNASKQIDAALVQRAPLLKEVACLVLYTIPFGLLSTPEEGGLVGDAYRTIIVPMVALRGPGDPAETLDVSPRKALTSLLNRRLLVEAIFDPPSLVDELVRASGGCPRDLLHLTMLACDYAGEGKVTKDVLKAALNRGRIEHLRPARARDFARIARTHLDKQIANDPEDFPLIYHRLLVHYNDSDWYDAHPLVMEDPRFARAFQDEQALRAPAGAPSADTEQAKRDNG